MTTVLRRHPVVAAMSLAGAVTLPTLGRQPLSWDEAVTLSDAQRSLPHLATTLSATDLPLGFYYVLMHGWLRLLSYADLRVTESWLRLPSAAAAVAAVGLMTLLLNQWRGPMLGLLTGCVLALHPLFTFYAQDARPYALVTLAFVASTWALVRVIQHPSRRWLFVYGLLSVVTVYLHLFALFAILAQWVYVFLSTRRYRPWLWVMTATVLCVLPLAAQAQKQSHEIGWIPKPSLSTTLSVLSHMAGGWAFIVVALVVCVLACTRRRGLAISSRTMFLMMWALLPPVALLLGDAVTPDLVARYGLVTVPAVAALIAAACLGLGGRRAVVLATAVLVVAGTSTALQQLRPYKYEDYRAAADTVGDLSQSGDAVLFLPASNRVGFEAYSHMEPDLSHVTDIALAAAGAPQLSATASGIDKPVAQITEAVLRSPRVFLLGDPLPTDVDQFRGPQDSAEEAALSHFRVVLIRRWGDLTMTELVPADSRD
jgi:mannosyltransferase